MPGFGLSSEASHQTSVQPGAWCLVLGARCWVLEVWIRTWTLHQNASDGDGGGDGDGYGCGYGMGMRTQTRGWMRRGTRTPLRPFAFAFAGEMGGGAPSEDGQCALDDSTLDDSILDSDPAVRRPPSAVHPQARDGRDGGNADTRREL